jgi:hypothetical protein
MHWAEAVVARKATEAGKSTRSSACNTCRRCEIRDGGDNQRDLLGPTSGARTISQVAIECAEARITGILAGDWISNDACGIRSHQGLAHLPARTCCHWAVAIGASEITETREVVCTGSVDTGLLRDRQRRLCGNSGGGCCNPNPSVNEPICTSRRYGFAGHLGKLSSIAGDGHDNLSCSRKMNTAMENSNFSIRSPGPGAQYRSVSFGMFKIELR